jgi:MFS family permease
MRGGLVLDDNEEDDDDLSSSNSSSNINSWNNWKTMKKPHEKYHLMIVLIICHGGLLSGYALGIISGILIDIQNIYQMNSLEIGYVVASLPLGTLLGCLFTLHIVQKFGFMKVFFLQNVFLTIGSLLISCAKNLQTLYVGRLIVGLGLSYSTHLNSSYLTTLSPQRLHEMTLSCYYLSIALGIFFSCFFGRFFHTSTSTSSDSWRLLYSFQVLLGGVHALLLLLLPESPQWLAQQPYQQHLSREILFQIFETQAEVDEIFNTFCCEDQDTVVDIDNEADHSLDKDTQEIDIIAWNRTNQSQDQIHRRSNLCSNGPLTLSWKLLVEYRLSVLCICILLCIQFFTGSYILRSYFSFLFLQFGFTPLNALNSTVVIALCHVFTIAWFLYQVRSSHFSVSLSVSVSLCPSLCLSLSLSVSLCLSLSLSVSVSLSDI